MFRRRKPDDEPEPQMTPETSHGTMVTVTRLSPGTAETGLGTGKADTGLGVPPRPPAIVHPPASGLQKDPTMARPPFASTAIQPLSPQGSIQGNPPMPPSSPPRPPGAPALRPGGSREAPAAAERRTLVVGRGISVQGMVQDAERLVVEGTVEASMIHAAELSVSPGGVFKGEVEVEDAEIAGTVDGTLTVRGSLVVRTTGMVLGTARCRRLQVEDGGQITGRIEMLTEAQGGSEPVRAPVQSGAPAQNSGPAVSSATLQDG